MLTHNPLSAASSPPPVLLLTRNLLAGGVTHRQLKRLVEAGRLIRVRSGRYVAADTPPDVVRAAKLGGRLDCISLLQHLGIFVLEAAALHIHTRNGASRVPAAPRDVVRHWRASSAGAEQLHADLIEALAQACRCQEPRAAIATLDSAWRLGFVDDIGLSEVFARLPRRFQALRGLLDRRSESGSETMMRLILRALGCVVELQVRIPGVGRVDFVVDGWLIIECDSEAHHAGWAAQKRDRRRDIAAAELGYTTIRPIAEDIFHRRDEVLRSLRAVLAHRIIPGVVSNSSKPRGKRSARSA